MLLFELQKEVIKGPSCTTNICPCCQTKSTSRSAVIQYLSFSFLPVLPVKVTTHHTCNKCSREFEVGKESRGLFPKISLMKLFQKAIAIPLLAVLIVVHNQYQHYEEQWQWHARHAPQVNDILYLDNYAMTASKAEEPFPIRMAKVIAIDDKSQTLSIAISATAYDSLDTAKRDFAVRNYLFDTFYMRNAVELSTFRLTDQSLILNIRRPFGEESILSLPQQQVVEKYKDIGRFFRYGLFNVQALNWQGESDIDTSFYRLNSVSISY